MDVSCLGLSACVMQAFVDINAPKVSVGNILSVSPSVDVPRKAYHCSIYIQCRRNGGTPFIPSSAGRPGMHSGRRDGRLRWRL
jgi:hypothetical protein